MFRSGESEDFHLDRNRQETLRNFSALSMHTNRPIKNEIQPRSISTPSLSAVRQRSVFFTRRSFAEIRRVSTGDRSCVQRIHEQLRRSVFFLFHSCFVVCQIRIQRTHIYIHIYMYIQQHQEIRKNHTLHQRYNLPNRPKQRTKISISLFTSFFHQKVTKHFQLWDLAGPLTRGIVIRDYVTNYDEPAVKWKTATKPVGLCHLRRAELWRSRPGWTLNASSPRRGLHSGPGVNQSFVLASLRVNRFRCSICLQRLHVHARTRPSV